VRVIVDFDRCEANGICMDIAPEVFHLDERDELHVLLDSPSDELRDAVEQAVRRCPKQAISLEA
jgi:ferredoxin